MVMISWVPMDTPTRRYQSHYFSVMTRSWASRHAPEYKILEYVSDSMFLVRFERIGFGGMLTSMRKLIAEALGIPGRIELRWIDITARGLITRPILIPEYEFLVVES